MTIEGVDITPGTGKSIAVDTVNIGGNKEFQILKIALGAEDAFDLVLDSGQQTMANSLPVVLSSDLYANVISPYKRVAVTPTITAGAYSANDCVGGKLTLTNAMRVSGGTGILQSLHIIDKGNQKAALVVQIFDSDPTVATLTDNAAIVHSTDITKVIRTILVAATDYSTVGGKAFADINIGQVVVASGSANLYATVMCLGTPTYVSTSDLIFDFNFIQG